VQFVPAGFTLITNFDSTGGSGTDSKGGAISNVALGYDFDQGNTALDYTREGPLVNGVSSPPPFDDGFYETVQGGGSATLTDTNGSLTAFSFYMGSPDDFNHLTLTIVGTDGGTTTLNGTQIWGGSPAGNGDQTFGTTVIYNFTGGETVHSVTFSSDNNAFEFDTLAGVSVPEPASWALMIMGFGAAGALLRSRRKAVMA
jgi:hypothetical protein